MGVRQNASHVVTPDIHGSGCVHYTPDTENSTRGDLGTPWCLVPNSAKNYACLPKISMVSPSAMVTTAFFHVRV